MRKGEGTSASQMALVPTLKDQKKIESQKDKKASDVIDAATKNQIMMQKLEELQKLQQ